jgi:hypothetical protein
MKIPREEISVWEPERIFLGVPDPSLFSLSHKGVELTEIMLAK